VYGVEETSETVTVAVAGCETDDDCHLHLHQHLLLHPHDDCYFLLLLLADVLPHSQPGPYLHLLELSLTTKRIPIKSITYVVHL
jgi:hypothetical protein